MRSFKKMLAFAVAFIMTLSCITAVNVSVVSAAPSISGGWYETLYAEWKDSDPDSATVEYKLHSDTAYTKLSGDDAAYLIRPASSSGYGRVDIPGLKAGRYDIKITASDNSVHTRDNIEVYAYDRSGYAHWNRSTSERAYDGVGAYKDDGTLKDNAIVIYVTDENKDTVTIPGYPGDTVWSYTPSKDPAYTRTSEGIGNILNNNYKFIDEVTKTHPLVIRLIGKVNAPKNLTPYNVKDPALGGAKGDNGNLAVMKWGRNVTLEGIGEDAEMNGWGFTVSKTNTHPADSGQSVEVRNITLRNYTEDGLGFQGEGDAFAERIWVHNNTFYPGYCANPAESDKGEGDGSCDFKRGRYYTMSYNRFIDCHKTNLLGSGGSDDQWFMTAHHNWYQNVASRQPLAANGNVHIYNTYFQNGDTTVDTRNYNSTFLEANYYENCKLIHKSRNNTCYSKSYGEIMQGGQQKYEDKGTYKKVTDRTESVLDANGFNFPDNTSMKDWDINPDKFYYDSVNKKTNVSVMQTAEEVPAYVMEYSGTQHAFPVEESGTITITVQDEQGNALNGAVITASGLSFTGTGNVYTARAELGAEYHITVSKEGYANKTVDPKVLLADGEEYKETVKLAKDYDGLAVVKLTGGSDNAPVKGASVKLSKGDELKDQGDGTYISDKQYPVSDSTHTYSVTVGNTGDYIANASYPITIKTTDEANEIHLDKAKGKVSVTVVAAEGSSKELDPSAAVVNVGPTGLKYDAASKAFVGEVDINTAYDVTASLGGWKVLSVEPAKLTASKDGVASAVVTMQEGGEQYTWNYTDGTNTDDFFSLSSGIDDYGDAKKNTIDFEGQTLNKAIKLNSGKFVSFTAPADGELIIVAHNRGKEATLSINDGEAQNIEIGVNGPYPVSAGEVMIKRVKGEPCIYLMRYTMTGSAVNPPTPGGDTSTTENSTEATTEAPIISTPVDKGDPVTNDSEDTGKVSVTYNADTSTYTLTDKSTSMAAKLNIPLKETIKSGKVVVRGTATPTKASGSWALVSITGPADENGNYPEIAALAANGEKAKNVTLRVNADKDKGYSPSTDAIQANKTYEYEFIIDLDNKSVELTVNGIKYTNTVPINVTEIGGFAAITAVSDDARNLTVSDPYIGIVSDAPVTEGLNDEIMWPVEESVPAGSDRGLTYPENYGSTEEENPVTFKDGDKSYDLSFFLQGKVNPLGKDGATNPMSATNDGIPVTGAFIKFDAPKDGVFTAAAKTNADKVTYVVDDAGTVLKKIDNSKADTTYDIIRFNVKAGKSYYIYSAGSRICFYYLGYTSGISVPEESSSESSSESTSESSSESQSASEPDSEQTTEEHYGDSDNDGKVEIKDVEEALQYVLKGKPFSNEFMYLDVNADEKIDSQDVAMILQHVLDSSYTLPNPAK